MTNEKYTKGPWKVTTPAPSEGEPKGTYSVRYDGPDHAWHVANVYGQEKTGALVSRHGYAESNARLIAAAPTMYSLIERLANDGNKEAQEIVRNLRGTL